ncbi:MAG: putative uridylyltransferase [Chlamydiia bacterium]|nr:putative uridylyltransferase [Chlamydiia bacterium]
MTGEKVGAIILAGGMGSRLKKNGPKGLVEVNGRTLFEHLLDQMTSAPYQGKIAIMTSPFNHAETKAFIEHKRYPNVQIFQQSLIPIESDPSENAPAGNGDVYRSFVQSGILDEWENEGITKVNFLPVDNPRAHLLPQPLFEAADHVELALYEVKLLPGEVNMGLVTERDNRVEIIEYFETDRLGLNPNTQVHQGYGYPNLFVMQTGPIRRAANMWDQVPWHTVKRELHGKQVEKKEKFIFDFFPYAKSYKILEVDRETCYFPIKTQDDLDQIAN